MARKTPLKERTWYPYAVAACIAVMLYVVMNNLGSVWGAFSTFVGFFSTVILGCVLAYLINPLARMYHNRVFAKLKSRKARKLLSNTLAFVTVILFLGFVLGTVIPQLISSLSQLAANIDGYVATLIAFLAQWGITDLPIDLHEIASSSELLLNKLVGIITTNIDQVISAAGTIGVVAMEWVIALMLSMYLLADKDRLKANTCGLLRELLPGGKFEKVCTFFRRCDLILSRYIVYNLVDALIVGTVNAIFMAILGLPYVGLVSITVAVCNLVPTFGPIVGGVIGAFILVLLKPWYALAFLAFTIVLQTLDGYFIKPRIFGDSLGVPGLWILVGIIVGGKMFGMVGILVAIPAVAIIDFTHHEYVLPWLMAKGPRARLEAKRAKEAEAGEVVDDDEAEEADAEVLADEEVTDAVADSADAVADNAASATDAVVDEVTDETADDACEATEALDGEEAAGELNESFDAVASGSELAGTPASR